MRRDLVDKRECGISGIPWLGNLTPGRRSEGAVIDGRKLFEINFSAMCRPHVRLQSLDDTPGNKIHGYMSRSCSTITLDTNPYIVAQSRWFAQAKSRSQKSPEARPRREETDKGRIFLFHD